MLSDHFQNGVESAKLMWSRLPNTDEEAEDCDVGIFKMTDGGTVESLDYEVLENCAYRQEQAKRGKLYMYYPVGVKWFFALWIGIDVSNLSCAVCQLL